jgi:hypothetical protein
LSAGDATMKYRTSGGWTLRVPPKNVRFRHSDNSEHSERLSIQGVNFVEESKLLIQISPMKGRSASLSLLLLEDRTGSRN